MGDRICIRLTDGVKVTPTFYGHWCGLSGLTEMNEVISEPANSIGGMMCNFIVRITGGQTQECSFDLWNEGEDDNAADWDWGMWTYDLRTSTWANTFPGLRDTEMTPAEVNAFVDFTRTSSLEEYDNAIGCGLLSIGSSPCFGRGVIDIEGCDRDDWSFL